MLETSRRGAQQPTRRAGAPARHAEILSVGVELPAGRITNEQLAEQLGVSEQWILSRTGIRERCQAGPDERLSDYATAAARKALARARVDPADVDLVLVATTTPDELQPNTAPIVAHELGTNGAGAFDIGSGCTGFLSAVAMAAGQVETGRAECIVVIGADFLTRINNYEDRRVGPLFADGVGAIVLGEAEEGAVGPIVLGSDGSHARTILVTHEERKIHMDGPEVFRHAVNRMGEVTLKALERSEVKLEDIDLFVYHQANARITRALGERLGLAPERVVDCIAQVGNASTATLPIALETAIGDGRLRAGANVLLAAFGSGFTWGAGVVRWGQQRGVDE
ncbi:MAG: beta-ketoacyl-ACP synthase 3 [Solirubrobacterales bacterium]|nr:beta-ketoacyl-ACP synthase 3 [Solirubrobacterales bacterium]